MVVTTIFGSLFFLIVVIFFSFTIGRIVQEKFLIKPGLTSLAFPIGFLIYMGIIYVTFIPFVLVSSPISALFYWAIVVHGILLIAILFYYRYWFHKYRVKAVIFPLFVTMGLIIIIFIFAYGVVSTNDSASFFNRWILSNSIFSSSVNSIFVPNNGNGPPEPIFSNEGFALQSWAAYLGLWIGGFRIQGSFFISYTNTVLFSFFIVILFYSGGHLLTSHKSKFKSALIFLAAILTAVILFALRIRPVNGEAWRTIIIFFLIVFFFNYVQNKDRNRSILLIIGIGFVAMFIFTSSALFMVGLLLTIFTIVNIFVLKKGFVKDFVFLGLLSGINLIIFFFLRNIFAGIGILIAWGILHIITIALLAVFPKAIEIFEKKVLKYRFYIMGGIFGVLALISAVIAFAFVGAGFYLDIWSAQTIVSGELVNFISNILNNPGLTATVYVVFYGLVVLPAIIYLIFFAFNHKKWKTNNFPLYMGGLMLFSTVLIFYNPFVAPAIFQLSTQDLYHRFINGVVVLTYVPLFLTIVKIDKKHTVSIPKSRLLKIFGAATVAGSAISVTIANGVANPNVAFLYSNNVNFYTRSQNGLEEVLSRIANSRNSFFTSPIGVAGDVETLSNVGNGFFESSYGIDTGVSESLRSIWREEFSETFFSEGFINEGLFINSITDLFTNDLLTTTYIIKRRINVPINNDGEISEETRTLLRRDENNSSNFIAAYLYNEELLTNDYLVYVRQ